MIFENWNWGWAGRLFGCKAMQIPASRVSCNVALKYAMSCNFGISIADIPSFHEGAGKFASKKKFFRSSIFLAFRLFPSMGRRKLPSPCLSRAISIRLEFHSLTHRVAAKWIPILTMSRKRQSQAESWFRSFYMFPTFFSAFQESIDVESVESSCTCWDSSYERVP